MPGITSSTLASRLVRLQSFKETVWGTPGLATARWMGVQPFPSFKPYKKSTTFDEDRGSLHNSFLSAILQEGGEFSLNAHATFEDIEFILQGGLQAVSPTGVGPYTWAHAAGGNAAWSLQSYTLEHAYDESTIGASGCIINKWSIKGAAKKQWEVSASGFFKSYYANAAKNIVSSTNASPINVQVTGHGFTTGMQVIISGHLVNTNANGTWVITVVDANNFTLNGSTGNGVGGATGTVTKIQTPNIADRTVEVILFPGTLLYMEASGGTLGTTQFPNGLLGFGLEVQTNVAPIYGGDSKEPIAWTYDKIVKNLSLKLLYTAQVKAFLKNTLEAGQRAVSRLSNTSGSKSATLDFAGVLADDVTYYPNEQQAVAVDVKLESQYEPVSIANELKATIVNSVSALP